MPTYAPLRARRARIRMGRHARAIDGSAACHDAARGAHGTNACRTRTYQVRHRRPMAAIAGNKALFTMTFRFLVNTIIYRVGARTFSRGRRHDAKAFLRN